MSRDVDRLLSEHKIRHYVYLDPDRLLGVVGDRSTLVPRESTMRGAWPCEAKCSCGWETKTGGATLHYIKTLVEDHKFDVKHGLWEKANV